MFHKIRYIILVGCLAAMSACSAANNGDNASHSGPTQNRPQSHILSEQFNALDKAKKLQRSLNTTTADRLQEIDEATR